MSTRIELELNDRVLQNHIEFSWFSNDYFLHSKSCFFYWSVQCSGQFHLIKVYTKSPIVLIYWWPIKLKEVVSGCQQLRFVKGKTLKEPWNDSPKHVKELEFFQITESTSTLKNQANGVKEKFRQRVESSAEWWCFKILKLTRTELWWVFKRRWLKIWS